MNSIDHIQQAFIEHLKKLFPVIDVHHDHSRLHINVDEAKQQFGNLSTSVALVLAKELKKSPREVATEITTTFSHPAVERIEIAGPGFINVFLTHQTFKTLA